MAGLYRQSKVEREVDAKVIVHDGIDLVAACRYQLCLVKFYVIQ